VIGSAAMDDDRRMSRARQIYRLEKGGRHIAFLLTELKAGDFELKLMRPDAVARSVEFFSNRHEAIAEANRQIQHYVADGWVLESEKIL
jgi:hypothetical protein